MPGFLPTTARSSPCPAPRRSSVGSPRCTRRRGRSRARGPSVCSSPCRPCTCGCCSAPICTRASRDTGPLGAPGAPAGAHRARPPRDRSPVTPPARTRVAIACQGGGSHTAFTAGVLKRLLGAEELAGVRGRRPQRHLRRRGVRAARLVGARCEGDPAPPARLLEGFWADNSATTPLEQLLNAWVLWAAQAAERRRRCRPSARTTPVRRRPRSRSSGACCSGRSTSTRSPPARRAGPMLLLGAVDVLSGEFKAFNSRRDRITADMVLASAAIPTLFRAVHVEGGTYWDGLFSQNPPVRELVDTRPGRDLGHPDQPDGAGTASRGPWSRSPTGATSSPATCRCTRSCTSSRRSTSCSRRASRARRPLQADHGARHRAVRAPRLSRALGPASKLNRDPGFIRELIAHGEDRAAEFLAALAFEAAWRAGDADAVLACFADDAELSRRTRTATSQRFVAAGWPMA